MRKYSPSRLAALGLAAAALVTGCAHKDSLVGTWSGTTSVPQAGGAQTTMTLTLTGDGKATRTAVVTGGRQNVQINASGTYTTNGSTLTETYSTVSASVNGQPMPFPSGTNKPKVEQFKLDGDTLTLTDSGSHTPQVLTRQKL